MYLQVVQASGIHRVSHSLTEEHAFVGVFRIIQLKIVLLKLCKACNFVRFMELEGFCYKKHRRYAL